MPPRNKKMAPVSLVRVAAAALWSMVKPGRRVKAKPPAAIRIADADLSATGGAMLALVGVGDGVRSVSGVGRDARGLIGAAGAVRRTKLTTPTSAANSSSVIRVETRRNKLDGTQKVLIDGGRQPAVNKCFRRIVTLSGKSIKKRLTEKWLCVQVR